MSLLKLYKHYLSHEKNSSGLQKQSNQGRESRGLSSLLQFKNSFRTNKYHKRTFLTTFESLLINGLSKTIFLYSFTSFHINCLSYINLSTIYQSLLFKFYYRILLNYYNTILTNLLNLISCKEQQQLSRTSFLSYTKIYWVN